MFNKFNFGKRGSSLRNETRTLGDALQFENLEHRRVLAAAVLEAGTMTVDFGKSDVQVVLGTNNEYFTFGLDRSTDLNRDLDGVQDIKISDVTNIVVVGSNAADSPQSFVLRDSLSLRGDLTASGLNQFVFSGDASIRGDISITLQDSSSGLSQATATAPGQLTIGGDLYIDVSRGNIVFDQTPVTVGGKLSLINQSSTGINSVELASDVEIQKIDLRASLRLVASNITDAADSSIIVDGRTYLKGQNATLGENAADVVDIRFLNFKFDGNFEISEDNTMELIGKNYSRSASVISQDWLGDAGRASTIVTNHAHFSSSRIMIGEKVTDFFSAGTLSFVSEGHVHVSENSSITLQGKVIALSASLVASKGITNNGSTSINIAESLGLQAAGDIELGMHDNDYFAPGTVSFTATNADVSLDSDTFVHLVDSKNSARNLVVKSAGQITDDAFASLDVSEDAMFQGDLLTLGDGENSHFRSDRVQFRVTRFASLSDSGDLQLFGDSSAAQLELISNGDIGDDENSTLNVESSTLFRAENIMLAETAGDELNTGWMTFDAAGDVEIHEDSGIVLGMHNKARNLRLVADGFVEDRSSAKTVVQENASFKAVQVTLGDADDYFDSNTLSLDTQGNVTLHDAGDIMLTGETRVNSLRLRAANSISNMPGAVVRSNFLMDLEGKQVDLGRYDDDLVASSTLSFETTGATKMDLDRSILLVFNNSASSVDIVANGDILDFYDASIQVTESVRLEGFDVILGDSDADCFFIADGVIDVIAAGRENVNVEKCG